MSDFQEFIEQIKLFLPKYLTPAETNELFAELAGFPENRNFYIRASGPSEELLQGDGWTGLVAIEFYSKAERSVAGVILSNSCDISPENRRTLPPSVLFSPLLSVSTYVDRLRQSGMQENQIASNIDSIRRQRITNIFYLPEVPNLRGESMILLDNIHTHPLPDFLARERRRLFVLNQYAFYIFLIKLSIHFSRFQEGVARF